MKLPNKLFPLFLSVTILLSTTACGNAAGQSSAQNSSSLVQSQDAGSTASHTNSAESKGVSSEALAPTEFDLSHFVNDFSRATSEEELLDKIPNARLVNNSPDNSHRSYIVSEGWHYNGMDGVLIIAYIKPEDYDKLDQTLTEIPNDFRLERISFWTLNADRTSFVSTYQSIDSWHQKNNKDSQDHEFLYLMDAFYPKNIDRAGVPLSEVKGDSIPMDMMVAAGPNSFDDVQFSVAYYGGDVAQERLSWLWDAGEFTNFGKGEELLTGIEVKLVYWSAGI